MSEERIMSDIVWTPERGENEPELRSISWNNLLLSDEVLGSRYLTAAEIRITPETALQSTVLLACARIISETVAGLPVNIFRRLRKGHEEIANEIPLAHVLGFAPNSWQTKFEFFEQLCMNIIMWGNSYTEVKSGRYGSVTELNNLHPSRMRVERLENGRLKYSYNDPQTGRLIEYTQDQIMHVRWTPDPDGVKGMIPIEVSRDAIALSRACEIYASKFWANMGRPGIVLQTDGSLSSEAAERLRDNWERIHRGVQNAYKTAVLTNGLKVESFGATNTESQFLDVRRFQCEELSRIFRLPLHLIQGQSGGNLEIQGQEFINYTLMPWLMRIEQAISRSLIYDDDTYYAKFDTRGLLRGDSNSRASFYSTMLNLGIYSINECRQAEGLSPLGPEGDKHLVAMNLQPLEEAVKPKPDPSMMPGFGSGAPPKAPGVPPSLSDVKTGKPPMEAPKGDDSAKAAGRAEARKLSPQEAELEEAHDEIADKEGKWSKEDSHYVYPNPFAARGIKCENCTHYSGDGVCGIVSGSIDDEAICKLWVIPQEKIAPEPEKRGFCPTGEGGGIDNSCDSTSSVSAGDKSLKEYVPFRPVGDAKNSEHIRVPTDQELTQALTGSNKSKGTKIGAAKELPAGTPVALRIDIPAFNWSTQNMGKAIYAVTVHEDKGGKQFGSPIGYEPMARLSGKVTFASKESEAIKVATGETSKTPLATVKGAFNPDRTVPADIDSWTPVGYDPKKAAYFYDKKSGQEVTSGTDAVSIGNTVFTREPKYGTRNAKTHYRSADEMMLVDSWGLESRAFCPTGKGGGIKNDCGSKDEGGSEKNDGESKPSKKPDPLTPDNIPKVSFRTSGVSREEFMSARDQSKRKHNFSEISPERFAESQIFFSSDSKAGCLVDKDGDLGNVFNNGGPPRSGSAAVVEAIKAGAKTLDCYDGHLPELYSQLGFVPVAKLKFVDEYAPSDWDYEKEGRPDVVVMAYKGGDRGSILSRAGSFPPYDPLPDSEYTDDFDEAKRTARLASDSDKRGRRSYRPDDQDEGRGVRPVDLGPSEESVGDREGSVEPRAFCATGDGGGIDNSCSPNVQMAPDTGSGGGGGSGPRRVVNVADSAIASQPTERSPDGKKIISSPFPKEDIYSFAGREFVSTVSAGKHLADQQAEARGPVINSAKPLAAADRQYVSDSHSQQVDDAIARGMTPVFYTPEERQRQLEEYSRIEPRILGGRTKEGVILTPENSEFLFRAVQALTSSNASPFANMQRTDAVMTKVFDGDGRISTGTSFGVTGGAIKKSLSRLQSVIDTLGKRTDGSVDMAEGISRARDLFVGRTMRVGDMDAFFRDQLGSGTKNSWKPNQYLVSQEVPVFSVFGPKFGPFFANNTGDPNHLTADIWATRTWGRITGELVQEAKSAKAKEHAKGLLKVIKSADVTHLHGVDGEQLVASLKKMASTGEIDDIARAWSSARARHYASTDYSEKRGTGGKLNRLAKNVVENDVSLMGQPGGGRRRANMIEVYKDVEKKTGLPIAYAQDVLWQHEQDAYASLGAKTATEVGKLSFYSDQIRRIANDPSTRLGKIKPEKRSENAQEDGFVDDYERGGRDNLLYWEMIDHLSDEQFVKILLDIDGRPAERRAFCPTGSGNGIDNSCSSTGAGGSSAEKAASKLGVTVEKVMDMAGTRDSDNGSVKVSVSDEGIHVTSVFDIADVEGGFKSESTIKNIGPDEAPEIVVDHQLMDVSEAIRSDPEKRHAAARHFFRAMTDSITSASDAGASKVILNAAGGARQSAAKGDAAFKGYTIWPRMGFDAPIPFHVRQKLPETLSHCRSLLDLHATREGTSWWKANGTDLDVQFDLKAKESPQWEVFRRFQARFSHDQRDFAYGTGEGWLSPSDDAKLDAIWEEIWDDGVLDDYSGEEQDFAAVENRAFCPTGEGGGVKNTCSSGEGGGGEDDSWKDSDESVETWDKEDLSRKSPIKGADKLRSFTIEDGKSVAEQVDSLGVSLDDVVSIGASMAQDADVAVGPYPDINRYTVIQKPALVVVESREVAGIPEATQTAVTVHRDKQSGSLLVDYNALMVSPKAQQAASVTCAREMVRGVISSIGKCQEKGVSEIRLSAAGDANNTTFKGYRLWPRFGFDGEIPRRLLTRLREQDLSPRAVEQKRAGKLTIQALYETKAGQEHWEKHGSEIPMKLKVGDESSPGWNRFLRFRSKMGNLTDSRDFAPGGEIFTPDELKKLDELWEELRKEQPAEERAFCATGEGGGIDNSCGIDGAKVLSAPDTGGGSGGSSGKWGGKTEQWGKSSQTEIWTPGKPLFPGAERFGEIKINRPNDAKGQIEDGLKMTIADAILASGPISQSVERVGITKPRLEIIPTGAGIEMHWHSMGAATGKGFSADEKEYADRPGTAVRAVEASRDLWVTQSGPVLHMGGFFIHPDFQGNGIGVESVLHSTSSPVVRLEMDAERYDSPNPKVRMTGYSAWPKYGYDAPMSAVRGALLSGSVPSFLSKAKTLSDVYAIPGGREWWKENGGPIRLVFDRSPRSRSWQTLLKYTDRPRSNRSMTNPEKIGCDSDTDEAVESFWKRVQSGEEQLSGEPITQEQYDRWMKESKERTKHGDSGEVQSH